VRERLRRVLDPPMPAVGYFSYPDLLPPGARPEADWLLQAKAVFAGYHGVPVVRDLDLEVHPGEVVALIGPNGAGKSTTLQTISGVMPPISGAVWWNGSLTESSAHRRVGEGMGYVTEQRMVFRQMSVGDNLRLARGEVDIAYRLFPELEVIRDRSAGLLSGGEQQMLALARALCRRPRLLLVDELSLGLAPLVVDRLLAAVRGAADDFGTGVVLVEQHVGKALAVADSVLVLQRGRIVLRGSGDELSGRVEDIRSSYFHEQDVPLAEAVRG
jgi:ABC-type branched-subunit amino acid transport system ATPase component